MMLSNDELMKRVDEFIHYIITNYESELCLVIESNTINLKINDKDLNEKLISMLKERLKDE